MALHDRETATELLARVEHIALNAAETARAAPTFEIAADVAAALRESASTFGPTLRSASTPGPAPILAVNSDGQQTALVLTWGGPEEAASRFGSRGQITDAVVGRSMTAGGFVSSVVGQFVPTGPLQHERD